MKKQMFLLVVPMALFCTESHAQVEGNSAPAAMGNSQYAEKSMANSEYNISANMGNYQYSQGNLQSPNANRGPATNAYPLDDQFTIKVNGLMNAVATSYIAVFNIVQLGLTAKSADSTMNSTIAEFKRNLEKIGIDTSDFKTDMISFVPKFGYESDKKIFSKRYNEVPDGFELEKNLYVRFKRSSALDGILSAAASAEIYDLVKVDYFLPNAQKLIDSLRLRCLMEAKSRIKSYEMVGFELDTMKKTIADNFTTIFPETRYFSYSAYSRPSFSLLKKRATDQPFVSEYDKPISRYYNQVDYDSYDIIINPVIIEPVVQLSYTITLKYFLKKDQPVVRPKKVYYIISKDGDAKQLPTPEE